MNTIARQFTGLLLVTAMLTLHGLAQAGKPDAKPKAQQPSMAKANGQYLYGKVVETMDSGGYTYVQLDSGKQKVWAAGPVTPVKKGDAVRVSTGMPMRNFHSNSLKQDFNLIYFSNEIKVADDKSMMSSNKSVLMHLMSGMNSDPLNLKPTTAKHPNMTETEGKIPLGKIKKAKNGKTIAEIFKQRKKLAGKKIRVRGKVIKYIGDVYGKNWLHIRDNSSKQDLLVITTDKLPKNQELVLVQGTVALDKDNGIGHIYPAALDDARILGK